MLKPIRKRDCKTALIFEKCVSSEAVTHARLAVSLIGESFEKTMPDSKNFCGYVSCMFFDRFSNSPGSIESLSIACSWLFELDDRNYL